MKKLLLIVLFFSPLIIFAQNNFYLGVGNISSFAHTINDNENYLSKNMSDIGIYYGNNILLNDYLETSIEVFYLNHKVVLAQEGDNRFELHQSLGFAIKPGLYYNKQGLRFSGGVLAVYVFDKNEVLGNQHDHFDESYFYGLEYIYDITKKVSFSLGYMFSKFQSVSKLTNHTLTDFSVIKYTVQYNLY